MINEVKRLWIKVKQWLFIRKHHIEKLELEVKEERVRLLVHSKGHRIALPDMDLDPYGNTLSKTTSDYLIALGIDMAVHTGDTEDEF